jgi:hypothetical protein
MSSEASPPSRTYANVVAGVRATPDALPGTDRPITPPPSGDVDDLSLGGRPSTVVDDRRRKCPAAR